MKSAYELAMERLQSENPESQKQLTDEQKKRIADVDDKFKAKFAEREIFLKQKLDEATATGQMNDADDIRKQLAAEKARIDEECEAQKEAIRSE